MFLSDEERAQAAARVGEAVAGVRDALAQAADRVVPLVARRVAESVTVLAGVAEAHAEAMRRWADEKASRG